jgi:hypothetical protein
MHEFQPLTGVPSAKLQQVVGDFADDGATEIELKKDGDTWTVTARKPD